MEVVITEDDIQDERELLVWYIDMIENYPHTFVYYLSENAYFKWFDQSVKGRTNILNFLKNSVLGTVHLLNLPKPVEKRRVPIQSLILARNVADTSEASTSRTQTVQYELYTPANMPVTTTVPSVSTGPVDVFACGDGPNIGLMTESFKQEQGQGDSNTSSEKIIVTNIFETSGAVEFRHALHNRGGMETKWQRPCTVQIEYQGTLKYPLGFSIHSIVYNSKISCRRNLLPEFDKCMEEDHVVV